MSSSTVGAADTAWLLTAGDVVLAGAATVFVATSDAKRSTVVKNSSIEMTPSQLVSNRLYA